MTTSTSIIHVQCCLCGARMQVDAAAVPRASTVLVVCPSCQGLPDKDLRLRALENLLRSGLLSRVTCAGGCGRKAWVVPIEGDPSDILEAPPQRAMCPECVANRERERTKSEDLPS